MRALTSKELADILFQTSDRLTAGILEGRSSAEKFRDRVLIRKDKKLIRATEPSFMEKLSKKILLHFEACAKVWPEHPRSLKKSALELKALGFSHEQIKEIKSCCYRFALLNCEPLAPLGNVFSKDYPNHSYDWCDDAFLGAALIADNDKKTKNTIFTAVREKEAYGLFQEHVSAYLQRGNREQLLLTPAKPHKRCKAILAI